MLRAMRVPTLAGSDPAEPYRVLGVSPTASADDVRRAFRTLVRRYHPDANPAVVPGGELKAIVAAYRRLVRLGVVTRREPAAPAPEPPAQGRYVDVYA